MAQSVGSGTEWLAELQLRPKSKKVVFESFSLLLRPHQLPEPHENHLETSLEQPVSDKSLSCDFSQTLDESSPSSLCLADESSLRSLCPADQSSVPSLQTPRDAHQSISPEHHPTGRASLDAEFTDSLLAWSRECTEGYRFVRIANRHTSFRNGLAFCAIINRFAPWLIDFDFLTNDIREKNRLAFDAARQLGIDRVPDPAALVLHRIPDPGLIAAFLHQLRNRLGRRVPPRSDRVDEDDWVIVDSEQLDFQQHHHGSTDDSLVMVRAGPGVLVQIDWQSCSIL